MTAAQARTRCTACGRPLPFADWSRGRPLCDPCARPPASAARTPETARPAPPPALADDAQLAAAIPDDLLDELVAALEAEARRLDSAGPLAGVLAELEVGRTSRERHWAAWGFAAGFALNVGVAKWAQVASGAPLADFLAPILLGGLLAGSVCAAIGWAAARLREPA